MTILSAAQWPLLQSLNEVKHKSGLFTCTATFISPIGESAMPTEIETSIGPVDVWPDPVVQTGTDGMQTITATGYGAWDESITDVTYGYTLGTVRAVWGLALPCTFQEGCDGVPYGGYLATQYGGTSFPAIFETAHVRRLGDTIPPIPTRPPTDPTSTTPITLRILDLTGADITQKRYQKSEFYANPIVEVTDQGNFQASISYVPQITMVKKNTYGTVFETEATYEVSTSAVFQSPSGNQNVGAVIDFGTFYRPMPPA